MVALLCVGVHNCRGVVGVGLRDFSSMGVALGIVCMSVCDDIRGGSSVDHVA